VPRKNFEQARDDVFVTPETIRKHNLRLGQWIHGLYQEGPRGPQLVEITQINGMPSEEASKLPHFDELKAINPAKRISFETTPERFTTRVVDIMAPVGRGQRGVIVSPPRSGKTTLLLHMAEAIREKYDEAIHLMVVLVDERPEEVTEFRRALPGAEIYASSNDEQARNHTRIAELAIERAKQLFGCSFANVQPHSGAQANAAVFLAMLEVGDTFASLVLSDGGHLSHGMKINFSGKYFKPVHYPLVYTAGDARFEHIDYDAAERICLETKPKMIIG
jgi:energy-coupling factor transporter ATP-binding protein EcfA2